MTHESGDRAAFLSAFAAPAPPRSGRNEFEVGGGRPLPAVAYEGVADFASALTGLGAVVRDLPDADAFAAFVHAAVDAAKQGTARVRVALTDEPECAPIAYALGSRDDVDVVEYTDAAAVARADVGFTGVRAAVARTGSIVIDALRAGGRTVSLLPPLHVAVVRRSSILAEPGDLWRNLQHPLASNVVQITGPSRSADIELVITLGVHGPRALWVGVID